MTIAAPNTATNGARLPPIERWMTGATRSYLFLAAFFGAGIVAAVVGFSHRGPDVLAYPLFAWSPFILVLALQQWASGIRRIRDAGPIRINVRGAGIPLLLAIALFAASYYSLAFWPFIVGLQQLARAIEKSFETDAPVSTNMRDAGFLISVTIGLIALACYILTKTPVRGS